MSNLWTVLLLLLSLIINRNVIYHLDVIQP